MTVELGQITLVAALLTALVLGVVPMIGTYTGNRRFMAVSTTASLIQCALLIISFGILTSAFVVQDFSVEYVARHSNSLLPMGPACGTLRELALKCMPPRPLDILVGSELHVEPQMLSLRCTKAFFLPTHPD